jgi:hypothetical protein
MQTIEKIFVEPDDEIIFIVEKILKATTSRVILVIPASSSVVSSIISLKLLSRQLLDSSKSMILVTDNPTGKKLAEKANLVVRDKISMVDKLAWDEATSIKNSMLEHKTGIKNDLLSSRVPEEVEDEPEVPSKDEKVEKTEAEKPKEEVIKEEPKVEPKQELPTTVSDLSKNRLEPKLMEVGGIPIMAGGDIATGEAEISEPVIASESKAKPDEKDIQDIKPEKREPEPKSEITKRRISPTGKLPDKKKLKKLLIIAGIALLALLVIGVMLFAMSYKSFARVEIDLEFSQAESEVSEVITVSSIARNADPENLVVPGYEIVLEDSSSGDGVATGKKETGEFAKGVIDIRNKSQESAVNLGKGQVVIDISTNLQYELTDSVSIPVDQYQRDIPVIAKNFGSQYNTDQTTFRFEGFTTDQLIGFGFRGIKGGTSEEITIVTAEDVDKVKKSLETGVKGNLETRLRSEIGKGEALLDGSQKFEEVSFEQTIQTGEEGQNFSVNLKMKVTALKMKEEDIKELAEEIIKKNEKATDEAEIKVGDFETKNIKIEGEKVTFELSAKGQVNENLKLEDLKTEIAGKSISEAEKYIKELDQVSEVNITYKPTYIPERIRKIPTNPNRIMFK